MKRRLVLTAEIGSSSLPPDAAAAAGGDAEVDDQDRDWKLFVLSFVAFFTCFYSFIF